MKVSLFLGAGASTMFGKPTTAEFLQILPEHLGAETSQFYKYLVKQLEFRDIEYVLQATKDIGSFAKAEIGEWVFQNMSTSGIPYSPGQFLPLSRRLERQIESTIKSYYRWKYNDQTLLDGYDQTLLHVYNQIFSQLRSQTDSVAVFTTNYDTIIETYCFASKCPCIDGFVNEHGYRKWTGNFDTNANNSIRLYKLHGSVDWKLHREFGVIQALELSGGDNIEKDMMIMPTRSPKEEEKATPFSEIFGLMKTEFQNQDACIVIGCSFRDEGVNEVFRQFIRDKKTIVAISPTVVEDLKNMFGQECESTSGDGKLYISPKEGDGCVLGFEARFGSDNAAELISKSLSAIQNRAPGDPCDDTYG